MKRTLLIVFIALCLLACVATLVLRSKDAPVVDASSDFIDLIARDTYILDSAEVCDVGDYAFAKCKQLIRVDLSAAEWSMIGEYAFAECTDLEAAYFPILMVVEDRAFDGCEELTRVVFYNVAQGEPFVGDDVFAGTPIERGEGYIYVPETRLANAKALFHQYEDQVLAIEDGYVN